jgi:ribosome maturation factor RimP
MIQHDIEALLRPSVASLGCEWWGCEFGQQGRNAFLRIYIDKSSGVGIDDCEQVSRQVSALLDVHDVIPGEYRLEISSPGIPRPLFYPEQFQRYLGDTVQLKLSQPLAGRRKLSGVILAANESTLTLSIEDQPQEFLFSNIIKANLTVERGGA